MLTEQTKLHITEHQAESTQRLIAAEGIMLALLDDTVQGEVERFVHGLLLSAPHRGSNTDVMRHRAYSAIATTTRSLNESLVETVQDARARARALATGQVEHELVAVARWAGVKERPPLELLELPEAGILDQISASSVASSLSSAFTTSATIAVESWAREGSARDALAHRVAESLSALRTKVKAHAATQAVDAYNAQTVGLWATASRGRASASGGAPAQARGRGTSGGAPPGGASAWRPDSGEPRLPEGWGGVVHQVWSAILDKVTCKTCWGLDGTVVPVGKEFPVSWSFPAGLTRPPIHPHCRCQILVVLVPESKARRLPGIVGDYERLKTDIRDYMRGFKADELAEKGKRHAPDFIRESLDHGSAKTLTKRFRDRGSYFNEGD